MDYVRKCHSGRAHSNNFLSSCLSFSIPWYVNARIGKNMIGKLLPSLCEITQVPVLTNHSIRTSAIRAMTRGGFESRQVAFISGHKSLANLSVYDSLTTIDRTKMALAVQKGHSTLDGNKVDFDQLARNKQKRKNDDAGEGPSKRSNSNVEKDIEEALESEFILANNDDSGLEVERMEEVVLGPGEVPKFEVAVPQVAEPAIPSSQAHNVADLIKAHINGSKELINQYIGALKKN